MRSLIPLLALTLGFAPVEARSSQKSASPVSYPQLFDAFTAAVEERFYDPHFRGVDWRGLVARTRPRAVAARDDAEFHRIAREMLSTLKVSHLELRAPTRVAQGSSSVPLRIVQEGGRRFVAEVPFLSHAYRNGIRPGDELLSPDSALLGPLGSEAELRFRSCSGRKATIRARRESAFWPAEAPSLRWRRIQVRPGVGIGYIRADRFDDGAAELADSAMSALKDTSGLIIDVRGNSGGNASAVRLGSYFTKGRSPALALLMRPYLEALGRPVTGADVIATAAAERPYTTAAVFEALRANNGAVTIHTEDLGERAYRGRVAVLIGPETGSAAEAFAWLMRERSQATLIGRETAGALLSSETVALPGGWSVVLPVAGIWGPDGQDYGDRPVPPHIEVPWSRASACAGSDPDLQRAFELIEAPLNR